MAIGIRIRTRALALVAVALIGAPACKTLAPDYQRPAAPTPEQWSAGQAAGSAAKPGAAATPAAEAFGESAAAIGWREFFGDAKLQQVLAQAVQSNRDLRVAALNVERARAQHRIQRAALFPAVSGTVNGSVQHQPLAFLGGSDAITVEQYSAGVGVSGYELDLYGRLRNLSGQALQQYLATVEAQRAAAISLVAETVSSYLTVAADRARLRLARQTLENQRASLNLVTRSFELGVASALDVSQARTSVETARADVARLTSLVTQDENALALVVGAPVPPDLLPGDDLVALDGLRDVPAGVPSEVLQRRPDILQAEHVLQGANANIGAARARYFPTVALTGTGGIGSTSLGDLFTAATGAWTFLPQITAPIFNAGAIRAGVAVARVDREIAVAQYEQAIQRAFREVSDALAVRSTIGEELDAREALVATTSRSYQLSEARFKAGIDNFFAVLDSQRSLYAAQQQVIDGRLARSLNLVTLYAVLGGGWQEHSGPVPAGAP